MNQQLRQQLIRFALVGTLGFLVDAAIFSSLFFLLALPLMYARIIAFVVSATVTWYGNRTVTFASADGHRVKQWLTFMVGASFSALPNLGVFKLCTYWLGEEGFFAMVALVAGIGAGMVSNYLISRNLVFRASRSG